jgi:hypothetical protein
VVAISTHQIVGGYSDASIRLWHMDDVYLADLSEQLAIGQIQQSDLVLWHQQQQQPGSSIFAAPFYSLSLQGSMNLGGSLNVALRAGSDELLSGPSPPVSPTCLSGPLLTQFRGQPAMSLSNAQQLLKEGSGSMLGVEVMAPDVVRRRGGWCARLRDAGCCGSSGSRSSSAVDLTMAPLDSSSPRHPLGSWPVKGAAAGASSGASPRASSTAGVGCCCGAAGCAACAAAVRCLACGSQDQQLLRALKEFVAIRSVSANKVSGAVR